MSKIFFYLSAPCEYWHFSKEIVKRVWNLEKIRLFSIQFIFNVMWVWVFSSLYAMKLKRVYVFDFTHFVWLYYGIHQCQPCLAASSVAQVRYAEVNKRPWMSKWVRAYMRALHLIISVLFRIRLHRSFSSCTTEVILCHIVAASHPSSVLFSLASPSP